MNQAVNWLASAAHARWLESEMDALLEFGRGARTRHGFGVLDAEGKVDPAQPMQLWIVCRMVHCFSLAVLLGRPGYAALVDHGLTALTGVFRDQQYGGWYASVEDEEPVNDRKEAYGHAFVLLAATSAVAAKRPGAQELLDEAQRVSLEKFWEEDEGMVAESWDRAFTTSEPYRGVNANMHTVEAYLAAADVSGDERWLERALRITRRVLTDFAPQDTWRLPEHFDEQWNPLPDYNKDEPAHQFRPFGSTIGHWCEWARLTLHLRAALLARGRAEEDWMLPSARGLIDAGVAQGWHVDGEPGFIYTVDFDGAPVVGERMHWVVCEALASVAALAQVSEDALTLERYRSWWEYVAEYVIDEPGAWHHELDAANQPGVGTWTGKPDIYHAVQATLIPRLPLAPALAPALAAGALDQPLAAPDGLR